MKKIIFILCFFSIGIAKAQLVEGDIAPDFTFNDINGNPQHLYSYLNSNKFVLLELSTTWCSPCWMMHDSFHVLQNAYNTFDDGGDHTGKILFVEADPITNMADLQGTGSTTLGDWLTGTNFTVMNPDSIAQPGESSLNTFTTQYLGFGLPMLILICPNKQLWLDTLNNPNKTNPWPPTIATMQWLANTKCNIPTGLDEWSDESPVTIYPNPAKDKLSVLFSLKQGKDVDVKLTSLTGQVIYSRKYQLLNPGDHQIELNTSTFSSGTYVLTIGTNEGRNIVKKISVMR